MAALREGRGEPAEEKIRRVEELAGKMDEYPVIGVLNLHKMPAAQLQEMRLLLSDRAEITMARKSVYHHAFRKSGKDGIDELEEYMEGQAVQPALIFTDDNPFSLFRFLEENKTDAPARAGDIATDDIEISAGDTGIDPGPAIGTLSSVGLQPQVEEGTIHIMEDEVVVNEGGEVTPEIANVLSMLDIKPMKIGLNMVAAYEDGTVFDKESLRIDVEEVRSDLKASVQASINLSVNSEYLTSQTAPLVIAKAVRSARSLALESGAYEEEIIGDLLAEHARKYRALKGEVEGKMEEPEGGEPEEEEMGEEGEDPEDQEEADEEEEQQEEPEDNTEEGSEEKEEDSE